MDLKNHPNAREAENRLIADIERTPEREPSLWWWGIALFGLFILGCWVQGQP